VIRAASPLAREKPIDVLFVSTVSGHFRSTWFSIVARLPESLADPRKTLSRAAPQ
jgi:hypothetical protein